MTNAEATITENAATVAEQGAHVAPEKASSKKGASPKKGAPKGQKVGRRRKPCPSQSFRRLRRQPPGSGAVRKGGVNEEHSIGSARRLNLRQWEKSIRRVLPIEFVELSRSGSYGC
jgi:hypothetical protein